MLVVRGLSADWDGVPALRNVDLEVRTGELVTLLGPNGSGKTTLLRCVAGLERPRAGTIRLAGRDLTGVPTHRRGLGMVAQEPSLFPHRTVLENVAYGLEVQKRPPAELRARVEELLHRLDLVRFAARYPRELSGGEQQRVALARALAPRPALVLLDEPFAAVDPEYRAELRTEFRRALLGESTAAIHVTHDREEGLYLGDRVVVLLDGRVAQVGAPAELVDRPASARVARFLGYSIVRACAGERAVAPEDIEIGPRTGGAGRARVLAVGLVGRDRWIQLELADRSRVVARRSRDEPAPSVGDEIGFRIVRWIALPPSDGTG